MLSNILKILRLNSYYFIGKYDQVAKNIFFFNLPNLKWELHVNSKYHFLYWRLVVELIAQILKFSVIINSLPRWILHVIRMYKVASCLSEWETELTNWVQVSPMLDCIYFLLIPLQKGMNSPCSYQKISRQFELFFCPITQFT